MEPVEGVVFIQGDFREPEVLARLEQAMAGQQADVVVSDMAPNLSGIESADTARIAHLVELAVEFAGRPPASPKARWSPRCSTAAATASWSSCSRKLSVS